MFKRRKRRAKSQMRPNVGIKLNKETSAVEVVAHHTMLYIISWPIGYNSINIEPASLHGEVVTNQLTILLKLLRHSIFANASIVHVPVDLSTNHVSFTSFVDDLQY